MRSLFFRSLLATWLAVFLAPASAADIREIVYPGHNVVLEGAIVIGDYDKLRKLIDENCSAGVCPWAIYLASPGGSLTEAIKIGRMVRAFRLETQIPVHAPPNWRQKYVETLKLRDPEKNYLCASACFFIAVAGIKREGSPVGDDVLLGMHRPYFSDADLRTLSAEQALTSAVRVRTMIDAYLKEMGVPSKYADLMFAISKDKILWVSEDNFRLDFSGFIPEFKDWLDARCGNYTDAETRIDEALRAKARGGQRLTSDEESKRDVLLKKTTAIGECWATVLPKLQEDAWKANRGR